MITYIKQPFWPIPCPVLAQSIFYCHINKVEQVGGVKINSNSLPRTYAMTPVMPLSNLVIYFITKHQCFVNVTNV